MGPRRLHLGSVSIKWLFWCAQGDPCRKQRNAAARYQRLTIKGQLGPQLRVGGYLRHLPVVT